MPEKDLQKAVLGSAVIALGSALETALLVLADQHGGRPGPWLDALQSQFVDSVKRGRSEGLTDEEEFKAMDGAIALINMFVTGARTTMQERADKGD